MGVPVTANTAVTAGKFLVGDLNQATQLWIRENLSVEFSREDSTNFRDGFVTVKVSENFAQPSKHYLFLPVLRYLHLILL